MSCVVWLDEKHSNSPSVRRREGEGEGEIEGSFTKKVFRALHDAFRTSLKGSSGINEDEHGICECEVR